MKKLFLQLLLMMFVVACGSEDQSGQSGSGSDGIKAGDELNGDKKEDVVIDPKIEVTSPVLDFHSKQSKVTIEGKVTGTDPEKTYKLQINGEDVSIKGSEFSKYYKDQVEGEKVFEIRLLDGETEVDKQDFKITFDFTPPQATFKEFDKSLLLRINTDPGVIYGAQIDDNFYVMEEVKEMVNTMLTSVYPDPASKKSATISSKYFDEAGMNVVQIESRDKADNVSSETRSFVQGDLVEDKGDDESWMKNAISANITEKTAKFFLDGFTDDILAEADLKSALVGQKAGTLTVKDFRYKDIKISFKIKDDKVDAELIVVDAELDFDGGLGTATLDTGNIYADIVLVGDIKDGEIRLRVADNNGVKLRFERFVIKPIPLNFLKGVLQPVLEAVIKDEINSALKEAAKEKLEFDLPFDIFDKKASLQLRVSGVFRLGYANLTIASRLKSQDRSDGVAPIFASNERYYFKEPLDGARLSIYEDVAAINENFLHQLFFEMWKWGLLKQKVDPGDSISPSIFNGVFKGFKDEVGEKLDIYLNPYLPLIAKFDHPKAKVEEKNSEGVKVEVDKQYQGTVGLGNFEIGLGGTKEDGTENIPVVLSIHGKVPLELQLINGDEIKFNLIPEGVIMEVEETKNIEGAEGTMESKLDLIKAIIFKQALDAIPSFKLSELLVDVPEAPEFKLALAKDQVTGYLKLVITDIKLKEPAAQPAP